jgi:hypothetical protein
MASPSLSDSASSDDPEEVVILAENESGVLELGATAAPVRLRVGGLLGRSERGLNWRGSYQYVGLNNNS